MSYFSWGIIFLFAATAIFYIIFVSLVYYWHEKKTTFVVVPLLYAFNFFTIGFLIVSILSIIINFLPDIINYFSQPIIQ